MKHKYHNQCLENDDNDDTWIGGSDFEETLCDECCKSDSTLRMCPNCRSVLCYGCAQDHDCSNDGSFMEDES